MSLVLASTTLSDEIVRKVEEQLNKQTSEINVGVIKAAAIPYIKTNGGDDPDWLVRDLENLSAHGFKMSEIDLDKPNFTIETYDAIYLTEGNIFYLAYWIDLHNLTEVLHDYANSKVYIGSSAGSVITMKNISDFSRLDDPNEAPKKINKGLDLVDFAVLVHWNNPEYQEQLEMIERENLEIENLAYHIEDGKVLFVNDEGKIEYL